MNEIADPVAHGRSLVDANLYMVLGTADAEGRPWATPVYFAPVGYREFLWVSRPEANHSPLPGGRLRAVRPRPTDHRIPVTL